MPTYPPTASRGAPSRQATTRPTTWPARTADASTTASVSGVTGYGLSPVARYQVASQARTVATACPATTHSTSGSADASSRASGPRADTVISSSVRRLRSRPPCQQPAASASGTASSPDAVCRRSRVSAQPPCHC